MNEMNVFERFQYCNTFMLVLCRLHFLDRDRLSGMGLLRNAGELTFGVKSRNLQFSILISLGRAYYDLFNSLPAHFSQVIKT